MTQDEIILLKNKHRKVIEVTITDGDDTFKAYFKRPNMDTLAAVTTLSKKDEVKAANVLFDNCWLGGDSMVQEDAIIKMSAIGQLQVLMSGLTCEVKNL